MKMVHHCRMVVIKFILGPFFLHCLCHQSLFRKFFFDSFSVQVYVASIFIVINLCVFFFLNLLRKFFFDCLCLHVFLVNSLPWFFIIIFIQILFFFISHIIFLIIHILLFVSHIVILFIIQNIFFSFILRVFQGLQGLYHFQFSVCAPFCLFLFIPPIVMK